MHINNLIKTIVIITIAIWVMYRLWRTKKGFRGEGGWVIKYVDRESIKYTDGAYSIDVWVNFGPKWFGVPKRIIMTKSIDKWEKAPDGENLNIDEKTKALIIERIREYYKHIKVKCDIE
jgi:hypothetical protein